MIRIPSFVKQITLGTALVISVIVVGQGMSQAQIVAENRAEAKMSALSSSEIQINPAYRYKKPVSFYVSAPVKRVVSKIASRVVTHKLVNNNR